MSEWHWRRAQYINLCSACANVGRRKYLSSTGPHADTNAVAITNNNTNANTDTCIDTNTNSLTNTGANADTDSNGHAHSDALCHTYAYADINADTVADTCAEHRH